MAGTLLPLPAPRVLAQNSLHDISEALATLAPLGLSLLWNPPSKLYITPKPAIPRGDLRRLKEGVVPQSWRAVETLPRSFQEHLLVTFDKLVYFSLENWYAGALRRAARTWPEYIRSVSTRTLLEALSEHSSTAPEVMNLGRALLAPRNFRFHIEAMSIQSPSEMCIFNQRYR